MNEIRADSTIGRSQNVCDNVGVFIANSSTKSATVEQRSTEESDQHEHEVATLVSDQKHIDELPVELLIDTFVYLSIEDLCAIRQTCKKWRQIAANCFQHNYSKLQVDYVNGRIVIRSRCRVRLDAFIQLVRKIVIHELDQFQHFLDRKSNFQQLKNISCARWI